MIGPINTAAIKPIKNDMVFLIENVGSLKDIPRSGGGLTQFACW